MTDYEIWQIASEWFDETTDYETTIGFARAVIAKEREACAQVCEIWADDHCKATSECDYSNCDMTAVALDLGKAIRSRT